MNGPSCVVPDKSKMADGGHIEFRKKNNSVIDEDICTQFRTKMQHGTDYGQNCKTAYSLQCTRKRSDDYNF